MKVLVIILSVILSFCLPVKAGNYSLSAHGNASYGVKRDDTNLSGYAQGNCAHCHEQHASINGTEPNPSSAKASKFCLFADNFSGTQAGSYSQSDDFCFYCHTSLESLQVNGITNKDYSATFGGATASVTGIMDTFNQTSYHNLYDVLNSAKSYWPSTFTADSNPCAACHNPHLAKRNKAYPGDPSYTAISKPSAHDQLWGDDPGERLSDFTTYYQAPYYYGSTSTYEPNNQGKPVNGWGSNMPDYDSFCTDCHNSTNTIYSTTLSRNLYKIDWITAGGESGGDKHGKNAATTGLNIKEPFASSDLGITTGFVLSCLDCHEPHGSPNVMLIRREVNGGNLSGNITVFSTIYWSYLCGRCHKDDYKYIHHYDSEAPYPGPPKGCKSCHGSSMKGPINCNYCHFHGGDDSCLNDSSASPYCPTYYTGRRCF
ncbi:MAG: hypothetical protein J7M03_07390 [Candidatus Desulfofervidaceae bacterium]|nr:hypothetical protein [Candidatus Desulfofervidaceae bacterium]